MKLKYLLRKNLTIRNGYVIFMMILLMFVVGGYFSYAVFTSTSESKGALNIITGNLYSYIDSMDLDDNKEITLAPNEVKYIQMKLTNINTIDAKINLYYSLSDASDKVEVGYSRSSDAPPTNAGYVLEKSGSGNESKTIDVRIVNGDSKNITVSFGSDVGLESVPLDFPTGKNVLEPLDGNINIINAYFYDQAANSPSYCITGEEATCKKSQCYTGVDADSCPTGTIIKYRVADNDIRYFHVIKDDGEHLTMQQREATTDQSKWYANGKSISQGPATILELLNASTSGWAYVNDQSFAMGETIFKDNGFTGGDIKKNGGSYEYNGNNFLPITITSNSYVMEPVTRKARMITLQEATSFGCKRPLTSKVDFSSCPVWMYNYMFNSTQYGGSIDTPIDEYWTMNAGTSDNGSSVVWGIANTGHLVDDTTSSFAAARAVVEVNKR